MPCSAAQNPNTQTGQHSLRLSLTSTNASTDAVRVICEQTRATINVNTATNTATGWTAALELSVEIGKDDQDTELDNWVAFVPAIEFTATAPTQRNVSVSGSGWIRLRTTTADGSAHGAAVVTVRLY